MSKGVILRSSLLLSIALVLVGSLFKIMHWTGADLLLITGLLAGLVFLGTAVMEVATARTVARSTRVLWLFVLLAGGTLGGILYLLIGRRSIGTARA